jgi:predicted RNA binding protein YcfA (HicA-like mRNA interferase family)
MRPAEIQKQLKTQPFVPMRMHISDGSHYDVRHPEMVIVSHSVVAVAVFGKDDAEQPEHVILCDPVHITRLEPINGHVRQHDR